MDKIKKRLIFICYLIWMIGLSVIHIEPQEVIGGILDRTKIDSFENRLDSWSVFKSDTVDVNYSFDSKKTKVGNASLKIDYSFHGKKKPFIAFLVKDLETTRDWSRYESIGFWSFIPENSEDLKNLSVMVYEEDGSAYIGQFARKLNETGWKRSIVPFSSFVFSSGNKSKDKREPLNLKRVKKIAIGIYQPGKYSDKEFSIYIDDIRLVLRGNESGIVNETSTTTSSEKSDFVIDDFDSDLSGWTKNISNTIKLNYGIDAKILRETNKSLKLEYIFTKNSSFVGYLEKDLDSTGDLSGYDSINFWSYIPTAAKDITELSIMLYEKDGSAYIAQHVRGLKTTGWEETTIPFSKFFLAGSWTDDENEGLDVDQIRKISIGIFQPKSFSDKKFLIYLNSIHAVRSLQAEADDIEKPRNLRILRNRVKGDLQKYEPPDGKVYHGVFAFSAPMEGWGKTKSDWEQQIDTKQISEYEQLSGRPVSIVSFVWMFSWEFPLDMCKKVDALGKTTHLGVTSGSTKLSDILSGKVDKNIKVWAKNAKEFGKPIFFRFLAEMNGNWNNYSEAFDPSQTHEMYVAAWQHVVDIFRKVGADNIIWVWAPTAVDIGNIHWSDYYPGDDYVDWVGMSSYCFLGNGNPESIMMGIYNDYADRKPIMIAECGAGDADNDPDNYNPGERYSDNPEKWINNFFDTLENKTPRVKAFSWFNIERERVWKIQESPNKIDVYKKRLFNNRYGAVLK